MQDYKERGKQHPKPPYDFYWSRLIAITPSADEIPQNLLKAKEYNFCLPKINF